MKRSMVDILIDEGIAFLDDMKFKLPPWAFWNLERWRLAKGYSEEVRRRHLGWDITDFGSGDFLKKGLLLFTIRNGGPKGRPYAEKVMIIRNQQVTPTHFHWKKTEDIVNRGGAPLEMILNMRNTSNEWAFDSKQFNLFVDGFPRLFSPGESLVLNPGESVCLTPGVYHSFKALGGLCLAGEISSVNDDMADNRFLEACGRFPEIEEDTQAKHPLCMEIPE